MAWRSCLKILLKGSAVGAYILAGPVQARMTTLRDIAPVQVYPVTLIQTVRPQALPDGPSVMQHGSVADDAPDGLQLSPAYYPNRDDVAAWRAGLSDRARTRTRWKWTPAPQASRVAFQSWNKSAKSWEYSGDDGMSLALGQSSLNAPLIGDAATLSGVSLAQSSWGSPEDYGAWRYMVSFGAVDNTPGATSGDLKYGPSAGRSVVQYGLSDQLLLESQFEAASSMATTGFGGQYDTQGVGVLKAAVSRGGNGLATGWRYRAAYQVDLLDSLQVSWQAERRTDGYIDLGNYQASAAPLGMVSHTWAATVPMGRWGDVSGTFERSQNVQGATRRRLGLTQQFWYSPSLLIGLKADRDLLQQDYDIGVRFSVPFN